MKSAKVCMIGAFGVGKTSLVRRYIHQQFDERYLTTLGVKIDTRVVETSHGPVKLVLWDMEGADPAGTKKHSLARIQSYMKGAHGFILVADGTRPATVTTVLGLYHDYCRNFQDVPAVFLANKADLTTDWLFEDSELPAYIDVYRTSALNGQNVETAFSAMGEALFSR